jgi:hypothetical protein
MWYRYLIILPLLVGCSQFKPMDVPLRSDRVADGPGLFELFFKQEAKFSTETSSNTKEEKQKEFEQKRKEKPAEPSRDLTMKDDLDYKAFKEYQEKRDQEEFKAWQEANAK